MSLRSRFIAPFGSSAWSSYSCSFASSFDQILLLSTAVLRLCTYWSAYSGSSDWRAIESCSVGSALCRTFSAPSISIRPEER